MGLTSSIVIGYFYIIGFADRICANSPKLHHSSEKYNLIHSDYFMITLGLAI